MMQSFAPLSNLSDVSNFKLSKIVLSPLVCMVYGVVGKTEVTDAPHGLHCPVLLFLINIDYTEYVSFLYPRMEKI